MKNYIYILVEAALHVVLLSFYVWCFFVVEFNYLFIALAIASSFYNISKILLGVKLLLDIIEGPQKINVSFMGTHEREHMDFFSRLYFSNIYFDDDILRKNYLMFEDVFWGTLYPKDKVTIVYYKRSRIILHLHKNNF